MAAGATAVLVAIPAMSASAHPLGNFTINHYSGLVVSPAGLVDHAVIDAAELPTIQQRDAVDVNGDGTVSSVERASFAAAECSALSRRLELSINGVSQTWVVGATSFSYRPGAAGLSISRLECELSVEADLSRESTIDFRDTYLSDRIGWREITASGQGMALHNPSVGSRSISKELRHYPNSLLSSPLDERTVQLSAAPGASTQSAALPSVAPVGWTTRVLGRVTATLDGLVGGPDLTLQVGLVALLLSLALGASHAALPGHGKTIMAAYMVGTRGTPRDAFLIGVTVTLAHTTGVLVLGALFSASATFAGDSLLAILGVVSGALVAVIGVGLLRAALTRTAPQRRGHPDVATGQGQAHSHGHAHSHVHSNREAPAATLTLTGEAAPSAVHQRDDRGLRRLTLVGMGLAGGLVPSPSALIVLLGAIALGRTAFGVLIVLGYGIGMAATLILVGYVIARMPSRLSGLGAFARRPAIGWLISHGPVLTACLVLVVGVGLAVRSASPFIS